MTKHRQSRYSKTIHKAHVRPRLVVDLSVFPTEETAEFTKKGEVYKPVREQYVNRPLFSLDRANGRGGFGSQTAVDPLW